MTSFDERNDAFCHAQVSAWSAFIDSECVVRDLEAEVARLKGVNRKLWEKCRDMAAHECYDDVLGWLEGLNETEE